MRIRWRQSYKGALEPKVQELSAGAEISADEHAELERAIAKVAQYPNVLDVKIWLPGGQQLSYILLRLEEFHDHLPEDKENLQR